MLVTPVFRNTWRSHGRFPSTAYSINSPTLDLDISDKGHYDAVADWAEAQLPTLHHKVSLLTLRQTEKKILTTQKPSTKTDSSFAVDDDLVDPPRRIGWVEFRISAQYCSNGIVQSARFLRDTALFVMPTNSKANCCRPRWQLRLPVLRKRTARQSFMCVGILSSSFSPIPSTQSPCKIETEVVL